MPHLSSQKKSERIHKANVMILSMLLIGVMACSSTSEESKNTIQLQEESETEDVGQLFEAELIALGAKDIQDLIGGKVGFYDHNEEKWALAFQHMQQQQMVYLSVNRYLNIDAAHSKAASVFTLTQIATLNHKLHGIKLQLNPDNGAITLSSIVDEFGGIDKDVLHHKAVKLIDAAKEHHPTLKRSLEMGHF